MTKALTFLAAVVILGFFGTVIYNNSGHRSEVHGVQEKLGETIVEAENFINNSLRPETPREEFINKAEESLSEVKHQLLEIKSEGAEFSSKTWKTTKQRLEELEQMVDEAKATSDENWEELKRDFRSNYNKFLVDVKSLLG